MVSDETRPIGFLEALPKPGKGFASALLLRFARGFFFPLRSISSSAMFPA